jgi:hypothetical protein
MIRGGELLDHVLERLGGGAEFAGAYVVGNTFSPGEIVWHAHALWLATAATTTTPAAGACGWELLVADTLDEWRNVAAVTNT